MGNNTYTGTTTVSEGSLVLNHANALGASSAGTSVASGGSVMFVNTAATTYAEPLTLAGTGSLYVPTFSVSKSYGSGGGGYVDPATYAQDTFTGAISLGSNIVFNGFQKTAKLTGALSGNYSISIPSGSDSSLVVAGSSNTTATSNSILAATLKETTYSSNSPSTPVDAYTNNVAIITGTYGDIGIFGGTLKGSGTVGDIAMQAGKVAPGLSPGCLNSGNVSYTGGTHEVELGGTTECTGYDQLVVTGTVDLGSATTLSTSLYGDFKPAAGNQFIIIKNDGSDAVTGTFANLAQGATFTVSGYVFAISYTGGDGNDVVLTVQSVPAVPDTGFRLTKNTPAFTLVVTLFATTALLMIARRYSKQI